MLSLLTRRMLLPLVTMLVVGAHSAQAATIALFDVVISGEISGIAPGTVNGVPSNDPDGFGLGGSASLGDAGILTIRYRVNAVTAFTNTVQNAEAIFVGSLAGDRLLSPTGQFRALDCMENGGTVTGCPFVSSNGEFPSPFTVLSNLPTEIGFDLSPGGMTTFQASAVIPNTTTVFTYELTAIPEPGTALLMVAGLCVLSIRGRCANTCGANTCG